MLMLYLKFFSLADMLHSHPWDIMWFQKLMNCARYDVSFWSVLMEEKNSVHMEQSPDLAGCFDYKLYSWTNNLWIMKPLQGKASQYCTCIMIWRNENLMTRTQSTHQTCKGTHNSEVVQIESGKLPKNGHYTNGLQLLVRSITQKKLSIHQQSDLRLSTIYKTWGACRLHIRPSQFSQLTHWVPREPSWISLSSKRGS